MLNPTSYILHSYIPTFLHPTSYDIGVDPKRIMLKGESAGAGLIHAVTAKMALAGEGHLVRFVCSHVAGLYGHLMTTAFEELTLVEQITVPDAKQVCIWMAGGEAQMRQLAEQRDPLLFPDLVADEIIPGLPPFVITANEHDVGGGVVSIPRALDRASLPALLSHAVALRPHLSALTQSSCAVEPCVSAALCGHLSPPG